MGFYNDEVSSEKNLNERLERAEGALVELAAIVVDMTRVIDVSNKQHDEANSLIAQRMNVLSQRIDALVEAGTPISVTYTTNSGGSN